MKIQSVSDAQYATADHSAITCMAKFAEFAAPIPFSASADDPEPHGRQLFADLVAGKYGAVAEVAVEIVREVKDAEIEKARDEAIDAGITFRGHPVQTDDRSRMNLIGTVAAVAAGVPLPKDFTWRAGDNVDVPLDRDGLIELAAAVLAHVNDQYKKSWALKDTVESATDVAEVGGVAWLSSQ
jgi:hypothetical protein